MSKKDKLIFKCFVCGKKMNDYTVSMSCYQFDGKVACREHPGIKEWYDEECKTKKIVRPIKDVVSGFKGV